MRPRSGRRLGFVFLGLLALPVMLRGQSATQPGARPTAPKSWHNPIASGPHGDEGPADRYAVRYHPITYGQELIAPLPGLTESYKFTDWDGDGDGRRDLITSQFHRGLFLYRNAAEPDRRVFESAVALVQPLYTHNPGVNAVDWNDDGTRDLLVGGDERRMIEPEHPGHLVIFRGQDTLHPPGGAEAAPGTPATPSPAPGNP